MKFRNKLAAVLSLGILSCSHMAMSIPPEETDDNMGCFATVGPDMLVHLLSYCDPQSLGRVARTSRSMNEYAKKARTLQPWISDPYVFVFDANRASKLESFLIDALKRFGSGMPSHVHREQMFNLINNHIASNTNKADALNKLFTNLQDDPKAQSLLKGFVETNQVMDLCNVQGGGASDSLSIVVDKTREGCKKLNLDPHPHIQSIYLLEGQLAYDLDAPQRTKLLQNGFDKINDIQASITKNLRINDLVGGVKLHELKNFPILEKLHLRIRTWKNPEDLKTFLESFPKLKTFKFDLATEDLRTIDALINYLKGAKDLHSLEFYPYNEHTPDHLIYEQLSNFSQVSKLTTKLPAGAQERFSQIMAAQNIKQLDIDIKDEFTNKLMAPLLATNQNLTELRVTCRHSGNILDALQKHPALSFLQIELMGSEIKCDVKELSDFLQTNTKLERLVINSHHSYKDNYSATSSYHYLSNQETTDLADAISINSSIHQLQIIDLYIAKDDWSIFKEGLKKNNTIEKLVLPELFGKQHGGQQITIPYSEIKDLIFGNLNLRYLILPIEMNKEELGELQKRQPTLVILNNSYSTTDYTYLAQYHPDSKVEIMFGK